MRKLIAALALLISVQTPVFAGTVTIAALGDSLTQGYGLPSSDGFVPQLQGWLDAKGADAKVLNAGVSGDTTAGGLARLGWTLTPDVDALIVNLGGNDMLRGIDPATARANLDAILATAAQDRLPVLLVGLAAPGNYGPDYKQAFDAIYPDLAKTYDALLFPNFFRPLSDGANPPMVDRALMQSDGIHPAKDGVTRIVEAFGPSVLALVEKAQ